MLSQTRITYAQRLGGGRREDLVYIHTYVDYSWPMCKPEVEEEVRGKLGEWLGNEREGSWVMLSWAGTIGWCYLKYVQICRACSSGKGGGKEEKRGFVGFE